MMYVDSAVLTSPSGCAAEFQMLTGRTNVWLAFQLTNLSIVVSLHLGSDPLFCEQRPGPTRLRPRRSCGGVFFVLTRTIFRCRSSASEAAAYRRVAKGLRNPRRIRDAQLRIAFLTLSIARSYPLVRLHRPASALILLTAALIILTTVILVRPCLRPAAAVCGQGERSGFAGWCPHGLHRPLTRLTALSRAPHQTTAAKAA